MTRKTPNSSIDAESLLSRQSDDDLTTDEIISLEKLLIDAGRRKTADEYRRLNLALRSLSDEQLPVNWNVFRGQVHDRIAGHQHRRLVMPRLLRVFTPLAAAAALILVVFVYWASIRPETTHQGERVAVSPGPSEKPAQPDQLRIAKVVFGHPTRAPAPQEQPVLAVRYNKTPPSADWKPRYDDLMPRSAVAMCGPDSVSGTARSPQMPVF